MNINSTKQIAHLSIEFIKRYLMSDENKIHINIDEVAIDYIVIEPLHINFHC